MTISDLGSIGEFIGAIAVIVTLIYLAIQVRQSKELMAESAKLARSAARAETFNEVGRLRRLRVSNPEVASIWRRGCAGDTLEEDDESRFAAMTEEYFKAHSNAFDRGDVISHEWQTHVAVHQLAATLVANPGLRTYWERVPSHEHKQRVEAELARSHSA